MHHITRNELIKLRQYSNNNNQFDKLFNAITNVGCSKVESYRHTDAIAAIIPTDRMRKQMVLHELLLLMVFL